METSDASQAAIGRVIDLQTAENGPHDVCEIDWQDVVGRQTRSWRLDAECGSLLVDPGRRISPETMAVHHIPDRHVVGAPLSREAAASVLRPKRPIVAPAAHRAVFERRYCAPRLAAGARWICTWKCASRLWSHLPRLSNQMLRYQRMPDGLDHEIGLPAHRAMPAAHVTAHHLRDMLNEASLNQLLAWSAEPGAFIPRSDWTRARQELQSGGFSGAPRLSQRSRQRPVCRRNGIGATGRRVFRRR